MNTTSEEQYVDASKVAIREITKNIAREWIIKKHYTHRMNGCRYALGVYYAGVKSKFFEDSEKLIGVIVYAHPVSNKAVDSIVGPDELNNDSVLELIRLHVDDGYGKNIESLVIGQSFQWLKNHDPQIKVLMSYADPEVGHAGKIYQATNWLYQGCGVSKLMPDYSLQLEEGGPWMHSRTVGQKFGNKKIENLAKSISHTFWRKEETAKHRYIYFLCDKKEKKRLLKKLKLPILPYSDLNKFNILDQLVQKVNVDRDGNVTSIERVSGTGDGGFTLKAEWRPQ